MASKDWWQVLKETRRDDSASAVTTYGSAGIVTRLTALILILRLLSVTRQSCAKA